MRRVLLSTLAMLFAVGCLAVARPVSRDADALTGPSFPVGDLKFIVPAKWQIEMVESPARGGQWRVPALHDDSEGGQLVAFYFGPGVGGTAKDNIESWIGTMFNATGHPAAAEVKHRTAGDFKISQVVVFGTYDQSVSLPSVPPVSKPNYGLLGAVVESPQGNIYWRFTGPEPLITANLALFDKMIASVKPQGQP